MSMNAYHRILKRWVIYSHITNSACMADITMIRIIQLKQSLTNHIKDFLLHILVHEALHFIQAINIQYKGCCKKNKTDLFSSNILIIKYIHK